MFMIGVVFEELPNEQYLDFARNSIDEVAISDAKFIECPLYAADFASHDLNRLRAPIVYLLDVAQQATDAFGSLHSISPNERGGQTFSRASEEASLQDLLRQVCSFPQAPAEEGEAAAMYEAVRLTSRIYIQALASRKPFSRAVEQFDDPGYSEPSLRRHDGAQKPTTGRPPSCVRIKEALKKTNIHDLWGTRVGVLLWITLVAVASSQSIEDCVRIDNSSCKARATAAQRFLSGVMIRAFAVHIFQQTDATICMLRKFVAFQQVLAQDTQPSIRL